MPDEKIFFYTNALELAVSSYDITLNFIRNEPIKGSKHGVPSEPARAAELTVSMSPMHAKAMLPGLFKAISDYEKGFGNIPVSPEIESFFSKISMEKR